jgi:hypothetical protein
MISLPFPFHLAGVMIGEDVAEPALTLRLELEVVPQVRRVVLERFDWYLIQTSARPALLNLMVPWYA